MLTDAFPMEANVHERDSVMRAARAFGAFRIAFKELIAHYNGLSKVKPTNIEHQKNVTFPYPKSFTNSEGITTLFTYSKRFDPSKLIFIAAIDQSKLFIKFTQCYSKDAHQYCATAGFAPKLYSVTQLPAGWFMVVMEYLEPAMYRNLEPQDKESTHLVKEIVTHLHKGGFVHGDIRPINMMVHREWYSITGERKLLLLDFDWAGPEDEVKYPLDVNSHSIMRHGGVCGGAGIRKEHDWFMVEHLFDP